MTASAWRPITEVKQTGRRRLAIPSVVALLVLAWSAGTAAAAGPCDSATYPNQCGYFASGGLPPFVQDAIVAKGGVLGAGNVLVLTSGLPDDADSEISNDMSHDGCGTNPDGWQTYDCTLLDNFVPAEDSVVLALSSEWFEWYQTFYTDWMTISAGGVPTVDVSINSWINNKVDIIPYGPAETGVVILTSLSKSKMVSFRVADSGDHIYDTAVLVVPATWFGAVSNTNQDQTLLCGNNSLDPGEECDDGNSNTDDGCSSICLGAQPPASTPNPSQTCGNLAYAWPTGLTSPYTCGADLCAGYRCVLGSTISPACYTAEQCAAACAGTCVDIPTAQLDCSVLCSVQPPASAPPPVVPPSCNNLVYVWPGGTTMPYTCDDACAGQRCVIGTTISPECYTAGECAAACSGTCVDVPTTTCAELCDLADQVVAELSSPCNPLVDLDLRTAANQNGPCYGNMEICKSTGTWEIADGGWEPQDEDCNGLDDDCNGIVDDMFETCGDFGLCQNTVNTCDLSHPTVPVPCVKLPAPSPDEICNDGLDNDCDGDADDGCECPDEECMPGETYATCPQDCPPPANFTACDDGNFCTLGDVYQGGVCVSGTIVNTCDDDNACTTNEVCDPVAGCSATKVDCDDHNECTLDSCDPSSGCTHDPNPACQTDADSDSYPSLASGGTDCDDGNAAIHPGAAEVCNAADDNCDTQVDEGFNTGAACQSAPNSCGVSGDGTLVCAGDGLSAVCSAVTPADPAGYGAPCTSEPNACAATAQGTGQCDGTCNAVTPPAADSDGDATPDCLDLCPNDVAKVAPGICGCGAPETVNTYYRDADADGFGSALVSTQACSALAGYVSGNTDCDDANASVHPGAAEICNGIDDNCDGQLEVAGDADKDGVADCGADLCPGTRADSKYMPRVPLLWLGANRWEVRNAGGTFVWATTKPTRSKPTIADTHGCSCKQILDRLIMSPTHPRQRVDLLAQYLLGCTMGTLDDWADR